MFRKPLSSYGAVALAAAVVLLAAPRAVHAIAATLVQLTNTTSNPGIVQEVPTLASQIVTLSYQETGVGRVTFNVGSNGDNLPVLQQLLPTGYLSGNPFVVPNGQSFVLTAIDATGCSGTGYELTSFGLNSNMLAGLGFVTGGVTFVIPEFGPTTHTAFTPGMVFTGGPFSMSVAPGGTCVTDIFVRGYLTSN